MFVQQTLAGLPKSIRKSQLNELLMVIVLGCKEFSTNLTWLSETKIKIQSNWSKASLFGEFISMEETVMPKNSDVPTSNWNDLSIFPGFLYEMNLP